MPFMNFELLPPRYLVERDSHFRNLSEAGNVASLASHIDEPCARFFFLADRYLNIIESYTIMVIHNK